MTRNDATRERQRTALVASVLLLLLLVAFIQWRSLHSLRDAQALSSQQLTMMRADRERITSLRAAPKLAASRTRANEELLKQIEQACTASGIDRARWQDSIPQPPTREPASDYISHATRLCLTGLSLRQLAELTYQLERSDATLSVTSLGLTATAGESAHYDAELTVAYRVYAPRERARDGLAQTQAKVRSALIASSNRTQARGG